MRSCFPSLVSHTARGREAVVTCCPVDGGEGGEEEIPRPLEKHALPAPQASWPPWGDISLHSSPPLLLARPAVPGRLKQAGPGKHRGWLGDGHRELPTAAPKAPPGTRRSLAPPSRPRRHARQESRQEPGWARPRRRPDISSEGREVTVHRPLMSQSTAR